MTFKSILLTVLSVCLNNVALAEENTTKPELLMNTSACSTIYVKSGIFYESDSSLLKDMVSALQGQGYSQAIFKFKGEDMSTIPAGAPILSINYKPNYKTSYQFKDLLSFYPHYYKTYTIPSYDLAITFGSASEAEAQQAKVIFEQNNISNDSSRAEDLTSQIVSSMSHEMKCH